MLSHQFDGLRLGILLDAKDLLVVLRGWPLLTDELLLRLIFSFWCIGCIILALFNILECLDILFNHDE